MNSEVWKLMLQQSGYLHLLLAIICGIIVGIIYFSSLRWSINRMEHCKHKFTMFAGVALLRIALFFIVLILIAGKNKDIAAIVLYVLAFFASKATIIWREKKRLGLLQTNKDNEDNAA